MRRGLILAVLAAILFGPAVGQDLEPLARAHRKTPNPATRGALLNYASRHGKDANGGLALLVVGSVDIEAGRFADAVQHLQLAAKRLPQLNDFTSYFIAQAQAGLKESAAAKTAARVWEATPKSPLISRAVVLAAKAEVDAGKPKSALDLLRKHYADLSQPQGDATLAAALAAAGDSIGAANYYQSVYYGYPSSKEAAAAEVAIQKLHTDLGDNYPPAMPQVMLGRALKLFDAHEYARAKRELESLTPLIGGAEREIAKVRIGAAQYFAKDYAGAMQYLKALSIHSAEADAERLFYLISCARRLDQQGEISRDLAALATRAPNSKWRLEALMAVADGYLRTNAPESYVPLYRACYEGFPGDSRAAWCHWRVAWVSYWKRKADAGELLKEQLRLFPAGEESASALYFLGRMAESARDAGSARAYYEEINQFYPNFYYGLLARERLKDAAVSKATPSAATTDFLRNIPFPVRSRTEEFEPAGIAAQRVERARLLGSAALDEWAEIELRFGAKNGDQPCVMAMEAAASATRRGAYDQAMRYIKSMTPNYLGLPIDRTPFSFWKYAFPWPYREEIEKYAKSQSLEPALVAGLIRQESEFNPKVVSPAKAYGLTQILPATGRELCRRLKMAGCANLSLLTTADSNVRLGSFYVRMLLDQLNGNIEATLAAYNAGKSRATLWQSWGPYREPAEFIETIPFHETRAYVQGVLRNAEFYRRLYAGRPIEPMVRVADSPAPVTRKPAAKGRRKR